MSPEAAESGAAGGIPHTDPRHPAEVPAFAATKLIAYLGNKRALLPRLASLFGELEGRAPIRSFLDPFAGSGAVARLARSRGYRVMASDIEEYAYWVNLAWVGVSADEAPALFAREGGLAAMLDRLNRFHPEREDDSFPAEAYIAQHYAPASTSAADFRRERLFYTRENAVFLDRVRSALERLRPAGSEGAALRERALILGPLILEAATHANTSGVFKACHKGFGGHGRDALGRILAPMFLEAPSLWPGPPAEVCRMDAAASCAAHPADLCYLDPPYNQHQYGSNYHLLNTLARWDRPAISEERREDGSLRSKAGIPPGWSETRSDFCSRIKAREAFRNLVASTDARFIVLSYNDDGLLPVEELYELLADRAEVELFSEGYVAYRGGRQSAGRRTASRELLFVASRAGRSACPRPQAEELLRPFRASLRLATALAAPVASSRIPALVPAQEALSQDYRGLCRSGGLLVYRWGQGNFSLGPSGGLRLAPEPGIERLPVAEAEHLAGLLEPLLCRDNVEACEEALGLLEAGAVTATLQRSALSWLRKLAHPKYREAFQRLYARLEQLTESKPGNYAALERGLPPLAAQARLRLEGSGRRKL